MLRKEITGQGVRVLCAGFGRVCGVYMCVHGVYMCVVCVYVYGACVHMCMCVLCVWSQTISSQTPVIFLPLSLVLRLQEYAAMSSFLIGFQGFKFRSSCLHRCDVIL